MSDHTIAGYAAEALASLTPSQLEFLQKLPKAELHAHLNGSIPFPALQQLANEFHAQSGADALPDAVRAGLNRLQHGVVLDEIQDFFGLFPAIYEITSTPAVLRRATRSVLDFFLAEGKDGYAQAAYLELRSTPRETPAMTRRQYIEAVLDELEQYLPERAALIVSLDRRMDYSTAAECIECAVSLKKEGRRVVGVDLCGDPTAGNMDEFAEHFRTAKAAGLGVTLHIAETPDCPSPETLRLLSYKPDRLGHATFLDAAAKKIVHTDEMCIEICLSSNLLCKTVPTLDAHHLRYYLGHDHPVAICTDDILPFRNSLLGEYALLMAPPPVGLGLTEAEIEKIAKMGMESRFR
ncbi:Metallo-dependent hydrolase [Trametes versicolor FP-101664 SS1]|uniref:Metallo-dependent hydrolase n=1 Tax=Trametes versicolor (strain FP-101664) TaxID=717944 RepID=UPI00046230E4|nr:Metallo-dependent hydrolase [Trametes versicolor FP-101664 SS1]EIW65095.1 Metallo-dependent hydrolase [Trametes versicolor FP-101664 SS1]